VVFADLNLHLVAHHAYQQPHEVVGLLQVVLSRSRPQEAAQAGVVQPQPALPADKGLEAVRTRKMKLINGLSSVMRRVLSPRLRGSPWIVPGSAAAARKKKASFLSPPSTNGNY
jgi:hypothetical protein